MELKFDCMRALPGFLLTSFASHESNCILFLNFHEYLVQIVNWGISIQPGSLEMAQIKASTKNLCQKSCLSRRMLENRTGFKWQKEINFSKVCTFLIKSYIWPWKILIALWIFACLENANSTTAIVLAQACPQGKINLIHLSTIFCSLQVSQQGTYPSS